MEPVLLMLVIAVHNFRVSSSVSKDYNRKEVQATSVDLLNKLSLCSVSVPEVPTNFFL